MPLRHPHRANGRGTKPSLHEFHCPMGNCDQAAAACSRTGPDCTKHPLPMIPLEVWTARQGEF